MTPAIRLAPATAARTDPPPGRAGRSRSARICMTSTGTGAMRSFIVGALVENRAGGIAQGDPTRTDGRTERRAT